MTSPRGAAREKEEEGLAELEEEEERARLIERERRLLQRGSVGRRELERRDRRREREQ